MKFIPLKIEGAFEIQLNPHGDHRGYFARTYDENLFREQGLSTTWVQENESLSVNKGTVRGLHFQAPPHAETKLVRAGEGVVLDVYVDLRKSSPTFGRWDSVELSAEKHNAIYIPRGCAHGFAVLSERALVLYKVDNFYTPEAEGGLLWNDPDVGIDWPVDDPIISEKDGVNPRLRDFESPFA